MDDRFEHAYTTGTPPWEIGRAQPEILALEEAGAFEDPVLDVGCGTGENAIALADRGHEVWGIDAAPTAIDRARAKAGDRGIELRVHDALDLGSLGMRFATAFDSGVFHTFDDADRARFPGSLASVLEPGGRYFLLCFSEHEPPGWGPRRVTQPEIRDTFTRGWRTEEIREARFESNLPDKRLIRGWLATIVREA